MHRNDELECVTLVLHIHSTHLFHAGVSIFVIYMQCIPPICKRRSNVPVTHGDQTQKVNSLPMQLEEPLPNEIQSHSNVSDIAKSANVMPQICPAAILVLKTMVRHGFEKWQCSNRDSLLHHSQAQLGICREKKYLTEKMAITQAITHATKPKSPHFHATGYIILAVGSFDGKICRRFQILSCKT